MTTKEIIELLKENETKFLKTNSFSKLPGIYAFFYTGNSFPLLDDLVHKHEIVYIGKTESSQEKRDLKTHFTSGKTGSSTVRKSIGSILCSKKGLTPIPRNDNDYEKGRFSHFKFDERSEGIITKWMENNLALSFYEYPRTKKEIEDLETRIINKLVPILNISKNPKNSFKKTLQQLRKNCALIAIKNSDSNKVNIQLNTNMQHKSKTSINSSGKYIDLWAKKRITLKNKLENAISLQSIQLNSEEFNRVGSRKNYSFNLEYNNGIVSNNINGSAVARDLAKVIEYSADLKKLIKSGYFKFSMDKKFCLWIEKE